MAIIEMPKGVTPSTIPEYATPNEWAEAFNVSGGPSTGCARTGS